MKDDDGPWVSLPSKHHPDEVYYFNVLTGVSTWDKPENFHESPETHLANSSKTENSEAIGYVIESLSPSTSPKRNKNETTNLSASESDEKKKRFCEEGNNFSASKNRPFIRETHYRFTPRRQESRGHFDKQFPKSCDRIGKISSYHPPCGMSSLGFRGMESWSRSDVGVSQRFKNKNQMPLHRLDSSSAPAIVGSASLRLERLKSQLAENKLRAQKNLVSPPGRREERQRTDLNSSLKDMKSYASGRSVQCHPYLSSTSGLRTESISLPNNSVDYKLLQTTQNSSMVPYRKERNNEYPSESPNNFSRCENLLKTTRGSLTGQSKKYGFMKDYFHTSDVSDVSRNETVLCDSTLKTFIPRKKFEETFPSFSNLKRPSVTTPSAGKNVLSRYRLPVSSLPSSSDKFIRYQRLAEGKALEKETVGKNLPIKSDRESFLRPGSVKNKNLDRSGLNSLEPRKMLVPSVPLTPPSKNSAEKRLKNFQLLLQAKNQSKTSSEFVSYALRKSDVSFPTSRSLDENEFSVVNTLDNCSDRRNFNRLPSSYMSFRSQSTINTLSNPAIPTTNDKSVWEWNSQCIIRDYNHKRITESEDVPIISSNNVNYNILSSHCAPSNLIRNTEVPEVRDQNFESHRIYTDKSNILRGFDENRNNKSNLGVMNLPTEKQVLRTSFEHDNPSLINSPIHNRSTNLSNCEKLSPEFVRPNDQTTEKLLQRGSKRKLKESKGGISKIDRRVQKQIRTVAPKLRNMPSSIVIERTKSEVTEGASQHSVNSEPKGNACDEEEMMDWEPIEPEKVVLHVEELRKEGGLQNDNTSELMDLCFEDSPITSKWFIVLDTNVLLSHLEFVEHLRDIKDFKFGMPTLYIPWVVLQELDGLKSTKKNPSLKFYARKAVLFLQDNLASKHPRVRGQPKSAAERQRSSKADDSILQCCLDLQRDKHKVLLLTNDRNLFNKAVVSEVDCCSAARLHEDLENRNKTSHCRTDNLKSDLESSVGKNQEELINNIICQVKECMGTVLEEVLKTEMILAYDRIWLSIVARKPPWTVNDVIFCIMKHWVAVFRLVLPSKARELLEKIQNSYLKPYGHSLSDADSLLNACISLIDLLKPIVTYKQLADKALGTLQELQKSLEQLSREQKCAVACSNSSTDGSTSDSDSRTIISNSASGRSRREDNASEIADSGSECDDKNRGNVVHDSDEDCISLVASSFCDNLFNKQLSDTAIKEGQEIVHNHLNKIWEKAAVFCGMLCDMMGVEPCVSYEPPDPFPSKETLHQNMLYFVKCVSSLLRCVERILSYPAGELFENHPAILNFCSYIRDTFPALNVQESKLIPRHVYIYCTRSDTRQQLEVGRKQFEQFESVLNDAVKFFMKENQSGPSVSPLM